MQKICSIINCLRFVDRPGRGRIGRDVRVTAGAAGAVCPCDQTTGEGRS